VKHTLASMSHWMQPAVPESPSVKQTFIKPYSQYDIMRDGLACIGEEADDNRTLCPAGHAHTVTRPKRACYS